SNVNVLESIRTSIGEITAHKLRSMLTLVGIVLGTTSLVVMVSVIGGLAIAVQKGLSDLGFDGVLFVTARASTDRLEQKKPYSRGLRSQDLGVLESGADLIEGVAPVIASEKETALLNGKSLEVKVEGITGAFSRVRNRTAEVGRFIREEDVEDVAPVAVIGK